MLPDKHNGPDVRAFRLKEAASRLCDFFGLRPSPPFMGLALSHCWLFCLPRVASATGSRYFSPTLYLALSCAMLFYALFARRKGTDLSSRFGIVATNMAIGVVGTFYLTSGFAHNVPFGLETVLTAACGASIGCSYLAWGTFYRELGLRQAVLVLFLTMALGSLLKIPFEMLETGIATAMLFSLLPIASLACWVASVRRLPALARQPNRATSQRKPPLGFYACGVAMFGVAIGINRSLSVGFFNATAATAVSHLIEVVMAVSVIVLVYRQQIEFDFSRLWMLILVVIATGLVIGRIPVAAAESVSIATLSSGHLLLVIFYWLSLCDVAHREPALPADVVFGLGWPAYALPMALTSGIVVGIGPGNGDIALLIVYALLLSVFFFMGKRCEGQEALFSDLNVSAESAGEPLARKVRELAQANGFSAREEEVALLYAQGRSRSRISTELVLSENTVRDHIAGIYRKLGVHNKQEYIDLLRG